MQEEDTFDGEEVLQEGFVPDDIPPQPPEPGNETPEPPLPNEDK